MIAMRGTVEVGAADGGVAGAGTVRAHPLRVPQTRALVRTARNGKRMTEMG
jgi:hypothetical protein